MQWDRRNGAFSSSDALDPTDHVNPAGETGSPALTSDVANASNEKAKQT
jgi:hypothetical protein